MAPLAPNSYAYKIREGDSLAKSEIATYICTVVTLLCHVPFIYCMVQYLMQFNYFIKI